MKNNVYLISHVNHYRDSAIPLCLIEMDDSEELSLLRKSLQYTLEVSIDGVTVVLAEVNAQTGFEATKSTSIPSTKYAGDNLVPKKHHKRLSDILKSDPLKVDSVEEFYVHYNLSTERIFTKSNPDGPTVFLPVEAKSGTVRDSVKGTPLVCFFFSRSHLAFSPDEVDWSLTPPLFIQELPNLAKTYEMAYVGVSPEFPGVEVGGLSREDVCAYFTLMKHSALKKAEEEKRAEESKSDEKTLQGVS